MTEIAGASHATPFSTKGKTKFGSVGLLLSNMRCKVSLVQFYYLLIFYIFKNVSSVIKDVNIVHRGVR